MNLSTMKLSLPFSFLLVALINKNAVQSFTAPIYTTTTATNSSSSSSTTKLFGLSAQDILKRARQAAGVPEEEEEPPLFDETIMNDFQQTLLLLEKRVKSGPKSLDDQDLMNLEMRLNRILQEMKDYQSKNNNGSNEMESKMLKKNVGGIDVVPATIETTPAPVTVTPVTTSAANPTKTMKKSISFNDNNIRNNISSPATPTTTITSTATQTAPQSSLPPTQQQQYYETSDEEGEAYNGKGGLGLAKGTTNTYIIDGMDEMSGEEYRKALQETISGRQAARRSTTKTVGNLASNNYLNFLNSGGNQSNKN